MKTFYHPTLAKGAMTQKTHSPFLQLPLEIREIIYHHLVFPNTTRGFPKQIIFNRGNAMSDRDPPYPYIIPTIFRVNEAMRIEVGMWLIRNVEFIIMYPEDASYFRRFLCTFPNGQGFEAVRRLDFPLFGRHSPRTRSGIREANVLVELMKECPHLTQVKLKFEIWYLVRRFMSQDDREPFELAESAALNFLSDPDNFVRDYGLHDLPTLQSLMKLSIEIWPRMMAPTHGKIMTRVVDCWPAIENLGRWFKDEFRKRGRTVDVFLISSTTSGLRWAGGRSEVGVYLNSRLVS